MNIERMQKINELARQLVDRGVYESLDEATRQAETMINKGDSGISSVFGTEKKAEAGSDEQKNEDEELRLQLRKISYQVNEQSKVIKDLKEQLRSMVSEINSLKTAPKQERQHQHIMEKDSGNDQTHLSKEATEKKSHVRSGKYESDDVSIEKFFYSGPPKD